MTRVQAATVPVDDAADIAFEQFSAEQVRLADLMRDPHVDRDVLRDQLSRAAAAERLFKDRFSGTGSPMVTLREREDGRLACEGVLLISLLVAFVGLFLPDLIATFWPLALTFAAVAGLGGWSVHFAGRLAAFLRRAS